MANPKFEVSLKELEKIVRKLEGGELTLEESLQAYEDGIRLARQCEKVLQAAKGKIEQLMETDDGLKTIPLRTDEE